MLSPALKHFTKKIRTKLIHLNMKRRYFLQVDSIMIKFYKKPGKTMVKFIMAVISQFMINYHLHFIKAGLEYRLLTITIKGFILILIQKKLL